MTLRTRVLPNSYVCKYPDLTVPGSSTSYGSTNKIELTQSTDSEGHPFYLHNRKEFRNMDLGGNFDTRSYIWKPENSSKRFFAAKASNGVMLTNGNLYTHAPDFAKAFYAAPASSPQTIDAWGTQAIAKVIPTKSEVDVVTGVVELAREGLPAMIGQGLLKSKLKDFRKVGDELLNYEFGIKPLLGDLKGVAKSIVEADKRIQQLERDSGRLVRRNFRFPDREESFTTNVTGGAAAPPGWTYTYLWSDSKLLRREQYSVYKTERWFNGAFTYYLNLGARQRDQMTRAADNARLLLGVKLDVETVWNLAPWTWLADWFGNVGDIATNISHFSRDGLVMPYGYMMAKTSANIETTTWLPWYNAGPPTRITDTHGFERKQRRQATPYGFGLTDLVLDARQSSILAALGITSVPRR